MKVESDYSQGPTLTQGISKGFTPLSRQNSGFFTREEQVLARNPHTARRLPQRSRTTHEHIPLGPQVLTITRPQPQQHSSTSVVPTQNTVDAGAVAEEAKAQSVSVPDPHAQNVQNESADSVTPLESSRLSQPRRPKLGAPRRSYSVTDYEPVPPEQRPSSGNLTLSTIPAELHYAVFDFLDPIDSACLGLTNSHFYAIHRRMHGSVPLSSRRDGPNELEWAWHLASRPVAGSHGGSTSAATTNTLGAGDKAGLAAMRVRGKGLCRKCGVSRCELHKHIREWVPETHEYCSVRDKFVPKPGEDARAHCYMSNPRNTARCGRHRVKKE